ncbi:hypothetical protein [Jiangella asiatica]|uniref:Zinc-finger domain-containing protein n=1 Tax=Jiangella asiatica TaxID=2530372 RepID=A0A4R5DFM3_9ACTN|nr:hypothetical protein [Jiangella asiatica]TDE12569.1 hypothetical protein E1269_06930 [Jiangella asiatica]
MTAAGAHPPAHVLAELAGGALDARQAREVQAHVGQCAECQAVVEQVTQVGAALRHAPAEVPVPEFVAARIGAALAAEQAARAGTVADGVAARSAPVRTGAESDGGTVAWFRRRLPTALAAAASVSVLGLAGYVVVTSGSGGDDASSGEVAAGSGAESASGDDSVQSDARVGPAPSLYEGQGPSAAEEEATAGLSAEQLESAVTEVWESRGQVVDECGQVLADELEQDLVGSKYEYAGVLVVLDAGDGSLDGWLLDTCNSGSTGQIAEPVTVPIPD